MPILFVDPNDISMPPNRVRVTHHKIDSPFRKGTDGKTAAQFIFNHIISRFGVPQAIVTDHGSHFQHYMVAELTYNLGLCHDISMPYYPQANG